jgi:hypothetical protein
LHLCLLFADITIQFQQTVQSNTSEKKFQANDRDHAQNHERYKITG